jgi:UDP-N-acetylglucosamine 1-carboxyvinyltransferase
MDRFLVRGGRLLSGEITPSGNKNAALPVLAACLLSDEPVVLENVPDITDVNKMMEILRSLGAEVERGDGGQVRIHAKNLMTTDVPAPLCKSIRASILVAGPLLARCRRVKLFPPGGDVIGRRRLDTHFLAFEALGAKVDINGCYQLEAEEGLRGAELFLDEASVTATENAIMAASLARGTTTIENAACEPHVQDLCTLINTLGGKITGVGSSTLTIEGVERLGGGTFRIGADYIEAGSWVAAAAVTGGEITIKGLQPRHLRMSLTRFRRLGLRTRWDGNDLTVPGGQDLEVETDMHGAVPIFDDGIWPQFPSDLLPILLVVATQTRGTVLIHEKMFESRLYFTDRLQSMGARIILCDPHRAVIVGPSRLYGQNVESPDIRAGIAMVLAGLCARGETVISNAHQIDRGYQGLEGKIHSLGGSIERIKG